MQAIPIIIFSLVLLIGGAVLAHIIGAASILTFLALDRARFLAAAPQRILANIDLFSLMSMPLFILAGEIMNRAGVTQALLDLASAMMARLRGGLGHVNILTSVFFAGISGSAVADAASVSNTLVPAMKKNGYPMDYACAITAASSVIGPIIPPSITLIFYGALMQTSVTALFIAGIVPGILMALVLFGLNAYMAKKYDHPRGEKVAFSVFLKRLWRAMPALLIPIVIMGGIVFGIMTPTEAAAVAVLCAIVAGMIYGQMTLKGLYDSLHRTAMMTGSIFVLLAAVAIFGYLAGIEQIPRYLSGVIENLGLDGWRYLLLLNVIFLIVGTFLDVPVALALFVPLLAPPALAMGVDPIHLGIVILVNLMIGLVTPPLGAALLVVSTVTKVRYWSIARAVLPFLVVQIILLMVLTFVPEITLAVPRALGY
ncbi:TRAP transporter large permease [Pseudooceanicola nanhaiensis]|uniref:TRAP transporter large permease n=1 Tax=Pseudooceanicola nanhaiensis TaxID=375761 RepID=UPI001CD1B06A|nr:TRAP transporter large permease [Pseudooceanicola nanhaiensis]MCA0920897.1 TRAP transporter large permease [Pseudooceanicola nanhaiensis]